jgi:uncharacterized protein
VPGRRNPYPEPADPEPENPEPSGAETLREVVRRAPLLMAALRAARDVDPPDWLISAGAIRDVVWDDLHGRPLTTAPRDVDLGYFDAERLDRDGEIEAALRERAPDLPWDVKNQAAVHLWYPERFGIAVEPFRRTADAVATFPETAACVGVRLRDDDELEVVAPHGLEDLLGGVIRHNPTRVPRALFEQRLATKGWRERWPRLRLAGTAPGQPDGHGDT